MKYIKCAKKGCDNKFGGSGELPLFCPDHNEFNNCEPDNNFKPQKYLNIFQRLINKITGKRIY